MIVPRFSVRFHSHTTGGHLCSILNGTFTDRNMQRKYKNRLLNTKKSFQKRRNKNKKQKNGTQGVLRELYGGLGCSSMCTCIEPVCVFVCDDVRMCPPTFSPPSFFPFLLLF